MTTFAFEIASPTHGRFVVIAPSRFREEIEKIAWFVQRDATRAKEHQFVVRGHLGKDERGKYPAVLLHRFIWKLAGHPPTRLLDHHDGDPLNNSEENIRAATASQNASNKIASRNNTSGIRGVSWNRTVKRWVVKINANGKETWIGEFRDLEEARLAREAAELRFHAEFAGLARPRRAA